MTFLYNNLYLNLKEKNYLKNEIATLSFISEIKQKVRSAQYEALKVVNVQLINLYWDIGKSIAEKQVENWGKSVVPVSSKELQKEFPGIGGFSTTNLLLMSQFYSEYQIVEFLHPLVGEISWSKNIANKCCNLYNK